MNFELSERIQTIKPSATLTISNRAKELKLQGKDVVALSAGEPDFGAPPTARKAGIAAIDEGFTHYTLVAGIPPLREAICARLKDDFGLQYKADQIVVGCGAKSILFHLFLVLLNPGDEVIIPSPYWVSYPDQVRLAGGKPVLLPTQESAGFVPDAARLEELITPKTKILVLNAPANPSGAVLTVDDLRSLAQVIQKYPQLIVLSDEIYALIVYDGFQQDSIAAVAPEIFDQCVVINGMSKAYAMTGWRIGYAAGPQSIMNALKKIQGQSTSNASSVAQRAALGALKGNQSVVKEMVKTFEERRDLVMSLLQEIPDVTCLRPRGAFYCFPNVSKYFGRSNDQGKVINDSVQLCEYLLEEEGVALVPGQPFGAPENLRLSFAASPEQIRDGIGRMRQGLAKLK